jgi:PIN domain nuclease of toxin-antitoxin system
VHSNKIVLDTEILLMSLLTPQNLNEEIKTVISQAQNSNSLYIAAISLWQIAKLVEQKQLYVYARLTDFLNNITKIEGLNLIQINANIASESVSLPGDFSGDSTIAIIIASTRELAATLITNDQIVISWANQGYLKIITEQNTEQNISDKSAEIL